MTRASSDERSGLDSPLRASEVEDFQRARILSAMVEVAADVGYPGAAVALVVARAGVSRRTFYELFDGREDCFLAAFEWGAEQMREAMVGACVSGQPWRERIREMLVALLRLLDSDPKLARICVIEALGAGKLVLQHRALLMDELISALDASAPRSRGAACAQILTADGIVGGAFSVIHGRLLEGGISEVVGGAGSQDRAPVAREDGARDGAPGSLIELHGQLMGLIMLPYLGPRIAGAELTRVAPDVSEAPQSEVGRRRGNSGRLLERLDMRLTYRTVRCLFFIGAHPGVSNREIAEGAEIADEGQASKLLSRLARLDLIANDRPHGPGSRNRWTLTTHGQQVLSSVQRH